MARKRSGYTKAGRAKGKAGLVQSLQASHSISKRRIYREQRTGFLPLFSGPLRDKLNPSNSRTLGAGQLSHQSSGTTGATGVALYDSPWLLHALSLKAFPSCTGRGFLAILMKRILRLWFKWLHLLARAIKRNARSNGIGTVTRSNYGSKPPKGRNAVNPGIGRDAATSQKME
ncbi:hypothetical protein Q3G72_021285 [Acer saccharum]|nr:hypothetical protein Q3G72_007939 [Acer saccharum]KAK1592209.1 hypothetical protein Q3G72_021285 [Acer saccharum]